MKKLLPLAIVAIALVGCAADHSSDVQAPIAGDTAKSTGPVAGNPNIPAAAKSAIPGGGK